MTKQPSQNHYQPYDSVFCLRSIRATVPWKEDNHNDTYMIPYNVTRRYNRPQIDIIRVL